jgi:hypothetical protein
MSAVDCPPAFTGSTFLVRIWLEWSKAGPCWRGQIFHVQSGEKVAFLCLDDMLKFIRGYVAMPEMEDENQGKLQTRSTHQSPATSG